MTAPAFVRRILRWLGFAPCPPMGDIFRLAAEMWDPAPGPDQLRLFDA